ncbi:hypothetical protein SAMN03159474_05269, partial [Pseudomonas sp. NFACC08-1]
QPSRCMPSTNRPSTEKPVGPSLLAIAVHQPPSMYLTWPHREHARTQEECAQPPQPPWRGSLLPLGCEAAPTRLTAIYLTHRAGQFQGLLRSPAGASSLATRAAGGAPAKQVDFLTPMDQAPRKPVGASLLAIAVHQPPSMCLTWPHREQARSHRGMCLASGTSMLTALPAPWSKRPKNRANWHISLPTPPP